jgi:hypothetical protein
MVGDPREMLQDTKVQTHQPYQASEKQLRKVRLCSRRDQQEGAAVQPAGYLHASTSRIYTCRSSSLLKSV